MTFGIVINTFGGQLSPYTIDDVSVIIKITADPTVSDFNGIAEAAVTFVVSLPNSKVRTALLKAIVYA